MPKLKRTPWEIHREKWSNCKECRYSQNRDQIVLARGSIPADIVFIGEAPGISEDTMGIPFVPTAPAGELFQHIVDVALAPFNPEPSYAVTNVVACMPTDEEGRKSGEPARDCCDTCEPRLVEFVRLCKPRLIVLVGDVAKKRISGAAMFSGDLRKNGGSPQWIPLDSFLEFVHIPHPSAIIRQDIVVRPITIKRAIVTISDAVSHVFG